MLNRLMMLAIAILLTSCANTFSHEHFEVDHAAITKTQENVNKGGRAIVFFLRENEWTTTPIPAFFYGVNDRLVSIMPVGSYVSLSLEPGKHKFSALVFDNFSGVIQKNIEADLQAGGTYYIGANGYNVNSLQIMGAASGQKMVARYGRAKLIHNPVTIDTFIFRLSQINNSTSSSSDILPTSEQVTSFLEGVAAVALVALMIYGAAASGSTSPLPPQQYVPHTPPPIVRNIDSAPMVHPSQNIQLNTNGSLAEIIQSGKKLEVRNISNGTRYSVENGRISGTDGSRYRVIGNHIYSDTGHAYLMVGNTLSSDDGHTCIKTGNLINCHQEQQ